MAQNPQPGQYTPTINPQENLPRRVVPHMEPSPIGGALQQAGGMVSTAIENKEAADTATWAGNQGVDLRLRMEQFYKNAQANAQPGASGFTKQITDQFDTEQQTLQKAAGNNAMAQHALNPILTQIRGQFGQEAINYEAVEGVKYRASSAKDNIDKLASVVSQKPDMFGDLMGQALTDVQGRRLGPDATLELSKYAQSALAKTAVLARAQSDPYGTMKALLHPEDADQAINALNPAEKEILLSHSDGLLHQRVADAERVRSMQDRTDRDNSSAALTNLIVQSRSPEGITVQDVLAKAPLFRHEPGALEAALNLASGKTTVSDPRIFAPLLHRAITGEDVYGDAVQHLGKDLSESDFTKVVELGDKGLPNAHKLGAEYINNAMRPGLTDRFNPVVNQSHANALDAYYSWARANPQATPDEASKEAKTLVGSYAMVDFSKLSLALPMPKFVVGSRMTMDPDATAKRTIEAEQSGVLSHDDALKEMTLISQWRKAIEAGPKKKDKAPQ